MTADTPRLRLGIVAVVALSLFAALFARLWYLQVLSAPDFRLQAKANSTRTVPEPAPRGRILDRNGKVLVDNRASNVVAIDRTKLTREQMPTTGKDGKVEHPPALVALLDQLSAVLGVPADELGRKLDSQQVSRYTPVPVAEDVGEDKMTYLLERADQFPAVTARRVAVRNYPLGNLAPHLLGYVTQVNDDDRLAHPGEYDLGDEIGRSGVERAYEKALRGRAGELKIEVDAKGKPIRVVSRRPPVQGDDVVLTIDADVQRVAEEALAQGLHDTKGRRFQDDGRPLVADAGAVVVLDTHGGVEALASYPTFDLPSLADGISTEEARVIFPQERNATAPFLNRALQSAYAPGSTWKMVTAAAALRSGLIGPDTTVNDTGTYTIPGDCSKRGCIRRNAGSTAYGTVDVRRALAVSSDVFFYTLGGRFWIERGKYGDNAIQDVAREFGFGTETQFPLSESPGLVLTQELKNARYEKNHNLGTPGWYTGDNVNLAIGQGVMLVTPIQLANAYATFANGGDRYQPNLALRIQRQDGTVVEEFGPRKVAHVDLPPNVWNPIMAGLKGAVTDARGTATNAFAGFPLAQWGVAGKTGTAQSPPKQDTALFAAFGPTQDLAHGHAVAVVMEQSGFGATAAAPVARRVFEQLAGVASSGPVQFTQVNGVGD